MEKLEPGEVTEAFNSDFGGALFNAYTLKWPKAEKHIFSRRLFVVGRMLRAMLDAEAELRMVSSSTTRQEP